MDTRALAEELAILAGIGGELRALAKVNKETHGEQFRLTPESYERFGTTILNLASALLELIPKETLQIPQERIES